MPYPERWATGWLMLGKHPDDGDSLRFLLFMPQDQHHAVDDVIRLARAYLTDSGWSYMVVHEGSYSYKTGSFVYGDARVFESTKQFVVVP